MDRTEELRSLVALHPGSSEASDAAAARRLGGDELDSKLLLLARSIHENLNTNEAYVSKILKLTKLKEFSNDNTSVITTLSEALQNKINLMEKDINLFKRYVTVTSSNKNTGQVQSHYKNILQSLNKIFTEQISKFKTIILNHSSNISNRKKRVTKYSHHESLDSQSIIINSDNTIKYAMFKVPPPAPMTARGQGNNNWDNYKMNNDSINNNNNKADSSSMNNSVNSSSKSVHSTPTGVGAKSAVSNSPDPAPSSSELRKRGGVALVGTSSIYSNFNSKNQGVIQVHTLAHKEIMECLYSSNIYSPGAAPS